jgi:SAM-dependent methyltransferase
MIGAILRRRPPPPAPTPAPASPPAVLAPVVPADAGNVGLRDAALSGWFGNGDGELYPGFSISAEDVVVDVGCGRGHYTAFCARQGAEVIFSDIDPIRVEATLERLKQTPARIVTPIVSDANPLPIADGVATRVLSMEVLEHVDDPAQFLSELARIGRPGALYLIAVPDALSEQLQVGIADPAHFQKPHHVRIIGRDEFPRMVTDAGLIVEHRGSWGFFWSIWWLFNWRAGAKPDNPLQQHWTETWNALLDTPGGLDVKQALDQALPKSQLIIARKP